MLKTQRGICRSSVFTRKKSSELWSLFFMLSVVLHGLLAEFLSSFLFLFMWLFIKYERYVINETLFFLLEIQQLEALKVDVGGFSTELCQASSRVEISLQYSGGVRFRLSLIWFLLLFLSALTQFLSFNIIYSRILSFFCAYLHNTRPEGYMVTQKDLSQPVASKAVPHLLFLHVENYCLSLVAACRVITWKCQVVCPCLELSCMELISVGRGFCGGPCVPGCAVCMVKV